MNFMNKSVKHRPIKQQSQRQQQQQQQRQYGDCSPSICSGHLLHHRLALVRAGNKTDLLIRGSSCRQSSASHRKHPLAISSMKHSTIKLLTATILLVFISSLVSLVAGQRLQQRQQQHFNPYHAGNNFNSLQRVDRQLQVQPQPQVVGGPPVFMQQAASAQQQTRQEMASPAARHLERPPWAEAAARQVILPYDGYQPNGTEPEVFNVIDNKRFVEAVSSRCWASTAIEHIMTVEPSFVIIRPNSDVRINATAPIQLIRMAGFDPKLTTKIFVHGFTQSYPTTVWLRRVRALFEKHRQVARQNLIIMDWGVASQGSYTQVAGMVSGMGSFLANFLMKLLEMGADRSRIHIIGHSLGAHLAGFAGKRIKPRIGRITALDPAGPCFGKFFSNSAQDRLEPGDAYEVDVYHYDDSFLGLPGQHGHFDVYVNGGSSQPGCTSNMNAMLSALVTVILRRDRVLSESHTRSTEVPTCELTPINCQQVAFECRDYEAFTRGECGKCDDFNGQCFLMGFDHQYAGMDEPALRNAYPRKRLYISTGFREPFCQQHYQLLVKFEPSPEMAAAAKRNKWRLQLDLLTDGRERLNVTMTNQMAANMFSYMLLTEAQPFRVIGAQLQVRASDGQPVALTPLQWAGPTAHQLFQLPPAAGGPALPAARAAEQSGAAYWPFALEVNFMSNIDPEIRRVLSSRLCPVAASINQVDTSPSASSQSPGWLQFDECFTPSPG